LRVKKKELWVKTQPVTGGGRDGGEKGPEKEISSLEKENKAKGSCLKKFSRTNGLMIRKLTTPVTRRPHGKSWWTNEETKNSDQKRGGPKTQEKPDAQ